MIRNYVQAQNCGEVNIQCFKKIQLFIFFKYFLRKSKCIHSDLYKRKYCMKVCLKVLVKPDH